MEQQLLKNERYRTGFGSPGALDPTQKISIIFFNNIVYFVGKNYFSF